MMMGLAILIPIAVVVVVVWVVRQGWSPSGRARSNPSGTALDILEERFARGEIDRDEFEQRRTFLSAAEGELG